MIPSIATAQRIVIKIGSALVVDESTAPPSAAPGWTASPPISRPCGKRGIEVIVVSSGAIALARRNFRFDPEAR